MEYTCPIKGYTIYLNLEKDNLLDEAAKKTIKDRYSRQNETSPQQSFARASCAFADNAEHAQRLYNYVSNLWFMFASPLLSNGGTNAGLPISCFLNKTSDDIVGIIENHKENAHLSVLGGGVGTDWSSVRSIDTPVRRGGKTPGIIPFLKVVDAQMEAFQQGSTRRGSAAIYLDISHPEIEEFIDIRDPVGGDSLRRCLNKGFHHGVNIPDEFMECVENNQNWNLIDPHTKEIKKTIPARELWSKLLKARVEKGEPFIHYSTTSNNALPEELKDKGLRINGSNLCSEIYLPTSPDRTAVCCLSSVNLETFDAWEGNMEQFIEDLLRMLDNALSVFIEKAPPELWRAKNSASSERSVGLGAMGFHSYLQKHEIAFESKTATDLNIWLFDRIKRAADRANLILGKERGEAPDMQGTGKRFAHTMAIAPNATSSIICGNTSPSIEPFEANTYSQDTLSGTLTNRNPHLSRVLERHLKDNKVVWNSIDTHQGSVQHLDFLTPNEKMVFKTAREIDQEWLIKHSADRQKFIDQGQSVNLFVAPDIKFSQLHKLHKMAWENGLKGLYYCRSGSIGEMKKEEQDVIESCVMCEG